MGSTEVEKREKKEKKDKKRKHSEATAAEDDEVEIVSEKKKKKDKKDKRKSVDASELVVDADGDVEVKDAEVKDEEKDEKKLVGIPEEALVPFANPLCGEKEGKKVFKFVKKAAQHKHLTRGVKETVKAIRKSPISAPGSMTGESLPTGIVVLAADISPMDVISHIPVLCEDHNIPYVYVRSRADLGSAGSTKRPTSVVMITEGKKGKGAVEEGAKEWEGTYKDLHQLSLKMGQAVKV